MIENRFRNLVEATAPKEESPGNVFTNQQIGAVKSGYLENYDQALDLLEEHDITVRRGKYKKKDR